MHGETVFSMYLVRLSDAVIMDACVFQRHFRANVLLRNTWDTRNNTRILSFAIMLLPSPGSPDAQYERAVYEIQST